MSELEFDPFMIESIKRITIHDQAPCYFSSPYKRHRDHVIFGQNKVRYIRVPAISNKDNCRIDISYTPDYKEYFSDFRKLCETAISMMLAHYEKVHICDVVSASLAIEYSNSKRIEIQMNGEEAAIIYDLADKYRPESFPKD